MANLIQLASFSPLENVATTATVATNILVNVDNIVGVKTKDTAYETTGVTDVYYHLPVNNTSYVITLVVEETLAEVLAAANANAIAT